MPSTRRQKAKTRKSREMDMMSDMDNLDVMLGNGSENPIERELTEAIEQSSVRSGSEANLYQRDEYRNFSHENSEYRQNDVRQSFETFSNEFNLRLSQEMVSMMAMVHSQINRAISTAISEKVLPEIQNIVSSMSSSGNRDTEASMSPSSQENRENPSGLKTKLLKKDSRSVGDLRDTTGRGSYNFNTRPSKYRPFSNLLGPGLTLHGYLSKILARSCQDLGTLLAKILPRYCQNCKMSW